MSYAERRLRKKRRPKSGEELRRSRCRICMEHIPACGGNYQCVHRQVGLCIKHIGANYEP